MFEKEKCFLTANCAGVFQKEYQEGTSYICTHCGEPMYPPVQSFPCVMADCTGRVSVDNRGHGGCATCGARRDEILQRYEEILALHRDKQVNKQSLPKPTARRFEVTVERAEYSYGTVTVEAGSCMEAEEKARSKKIEFTKPDSPQYSVIDTRPLDKQEEGGV